MFPADTSNAVSTNLLKTIGREFGDFSFKARKHREKVEQFLQKL